MSKHFYNIVHKNTAFVLLLLLFCIHAIGQNKHMGNTSNRSSALVADASNTKSFGYQRMNEVRTALERQSLASFVNEFEVKSVNNSLATTVETLPAGTLIIAMDFALQENDNNRLRRAYGLAVRLLHAGIPLKWIIDPNKTSRTTVDMSASARLRYPSTGGYATRDFKTGPIAIFPGFEAQAAGVINSFGNGIRVYELQNATAANIHSNLSHKPFVFVEQSENPTIHTSILSAAGLTSGTHYTTGSMTSVTQDQCVTIITVPHNGDINTAERNAVRAFVQNGGNFFAQCAAIRGFQGSTPRAFLNSGYRDNPGIGTFLYSNPQEPSAQFEGTIADEGGSQEDFGFTTDPPGGTRIVHDNQNDYKAYTGRMDGVTTNDGGYVHYLAGHDHDGNINADRYYLNAVLRQSVRPQQCQLNLCPTSLRLNTSKSSYCAGESITLTVSVTGLNPGAYIWQYSDDGVNFNSYPPAGSGQTWVLGPSELAYKKRWWRVIADCGQQIVSHSVTTTYIPAPSISIPDVSTCAGQPVTLTANGYDGNAGCFDLTDYRTAVDTRGSLGVSGGSMQIALPITYFDGGEGLNYYDIQRVGGANDYVDYTFSFPATNYSGMRQFLVDHGGFGMPVYQVWFHDASQGYSGGAVTSGPTSGTNVFDLPADPAFKDELDHIIIRVHADWIGGVGTTVRVHLLNLRFCGRSIQWNTGETTPSITVNPSVATTYSVTANYAGCTSTAQGTVYLNDVPATGYIAGPSTVCVPFGWTGGVWSIYGYSGTPMWQYSLDNVNWTDWGGGGSSPGGAINQSPFFIRVRLTSSAGCVAYTPVFTVTTTTPSVLSVTSTSTCPGQPATLTVNGYDPNVGCYEISRFGTSVDPRTSLASSSPGDIAITQGLSYYNNINFFYLQRVGANGGQYVDYALNVSHNLDPYSKLTFNHNGYGSVRYQVFIHDSGQGYSLLGDTGGGVGGGIVTFNLPNDNNLIDQVDQILIRVYADWVGGIGASAAFHIGSINACSSSLVWNTGETTTSITVNPSTTTNYTATVTYDYGQCPTSATGTVTVNGISVGGTVSPASQTVCASSGVVPVTPTLSGNTGTVVRWEFMSPGSGWNDWGGGGSTTAPGPCCFNTPGTWKVRAIIKNGVCAEVASSEADIIVNADPSAPIVGTITQPTCTTPTGVVSLSGLPSGNYTIRLNNGFSATSNTPTFDFGGLASGTTYTFAVTDASGCTSPQSTNAIINAIPANPTLGGATSVCAGRTANVTPGTAGSWTSSNTAIATVTNAGVVTGVSAGTITLTYTRTSDGCSNTVSFTVNACCPVLTNNVGANGNPTTCSGTDGSITICGLGANQGGYVLSYNKNGAPQTPVTITANSSGCYVLSGLAAGSYSQIKVTHPALCPGGSNILNPITLVDPAPATITKGTTMNPSACGIADGFIDISGLTPGTLYTLNYNKNGGPQTPIVFNATGTSYRIQNLTSGNYTDIRVSYNGCVSNSLFHTLIDPTTPVINLTASSNPTLCSGNDGSFVVSGLAPGSYILYYSRNSWNQTPISFTISGTSYTVNGLSAGSYTNIRVISNGCVSNSVSVTLSDPGAPVINLGTPNMPSACSFSDGSFTINGLVPGLRYTLRYRRNGINQTPIVFTAVGSSYTLTGLSAAIYSSITVTQGGCISNALTQVITDPSGPVIAAAVTSSPTICGANDGSITISGLTNGLTYTLNFVFNGVQQAPTTFTASGTTYVLSALVAGSYTGINITQGGCTSNSVNLILSNPNGASIDSYAVDAQTCVPGNDGSIIITGLSQGVTYSLTYKKNGVAQSSISINATTTSYIIAGLTIGNYTEIKVDQAGCVSNAVNEFIMGPTPVAPPVLNPTTLTNDCFSVLADLTAVSATNNPGGLTLTWHTATPATSSNVVADPENVGAGTYYASFFSSATQCYSGTTPIVVTINQNPSTPAIGTIIQPTCTSPTGSVVLSGLLSGNWTITRSPGGVTYSGSGTSYTVTGLPPGATYTFTVTNANNCTSPKSSNVVINSVPSAPVLGGATAVCVNSTANVTPSTGGTWTSSNSSLATVTNAGVVTGISAGTVTLTFTRLSDGCSNSRTFTVRANPTAPIVGTITQPTCSVPTGSVALSGLATGGWTITRLPDGVFTTGGSTSTTLLNLPAGTTYTFLVTNSNNCTSPASGNVVINSAPSCLPPIATDDFNNTPINKPVSGNVLTNDDDPQDLPLTVNTSIPTICPPKHGTVVMQANGNYTYTPTNNFVGTDNFCYVVCNSVGLCDTATVTIDIIPLVTKNSVVANDDATQTQVGAPVKVRVLGNDFDPQGDKFASVTKITNPTNGTVVYNPTDSSFTYSPTGAFVGKNSFKYVLCDVRGACDTATVTIDVLPVRPGNDPPVAVDDANVTRVNVPVSGTVATNDSDPNSDPLVFTKLTNPANGTVVFNPNGTYTYTPNNNYAGSDRFIYKVCDNGTPNLCDTATVYITVLVSPPIATDDINNTPINKPVSGNVLTNDDDPQGLPLTVNTTIPTICPPKHGTVVIQANGNYTYTPTNNFVGTDNFCYVVCNSAGLCDTATVTIDILPRLTTNSVVANDDASQTQVGVPVKVRVLGNDFDPQGDKFASVTRITNPTNGTVVYNPSDSSFTYSPTGAFVGKNSFKYVLCDVKGACDTATVTIDVLPVRPGNDPPVAVDDANVTRVNVPVSGTVATNDSDPNNDPLVFTKLTNPANGTVVFNPNGTYTYTPNNNYAGPDRFIYKVCDNGTPNLCDTATVYITVLVSPPIATDDINNTPINKPVSGNVLTNDDDPQGLPLTVNTSIPTICPPKHGTVVMQANGNYTYTPTNNFVGTDNFCYVVCNSAGLCDTATVTIDILPIITINSVVANDDASQTQVGVPVKVRVLANDFDPQGDKFASVTKITNPTNGTVVYNPSDSSFTYTPTGLFVGKDRFKYVLCDVKGACDTATVTVDVLPLIPGNDPPVAVDDANVTQVNVPVSGTVARNDSDPNNDPLVFTKLTNPANGTVVFNPNGTYTYTPNSNYVGPDRFIYKVCDNGTPNLCDTATVYITILQVTKVALLPKVYLQGSLFGVFSGNLMRDDLRVKNLIPRKSPYLAWNPITPADTITSNTVLTVTGQNAIVDWVFVELRSATDSTKVIDSRSALVQRDGDIVDVDGTSAIVFTSAIPANYFVVVKHRNHLGVMTKNALPLTLISTVVDFRLAATPTYVLANSPIHESQVNVVQGKALWAGNALYDGQVIYQGTANDVNIVYQQVIGAAANVIGLPFFILAGYHTGDINMDGEVIFQGTTNDIEYIYQNVVNNHGGNSLKQSFFIIQEQLPK